MPNAQVAPVDKALDIVPGIPPADYSSVRRFELPDITRQSWVVERLCKEYAHIQNYNAARSFLNGLIYNNSFLFLSQPNSCALAQLIRAYSLTPENTVAECFVWCQDPTSKEHLEEAALFYHEFEVWARRQACSTMVLAESSDVPAELIKPHVGRMMRREQWFAKVE